eukprot:TRINITY_DN3686_c0_g1_i1.p1 TRINITY_DN3686_c0_g1~~TRINITY_DN3686_c0_g1_i1.p1  ORF type:complete len:674 (+),score=188.91 TRINITY_DN3686_c0_g1_i1:267-2024(+)
MAVAAGTSGALVAALSGGAPGALPLLAVLGECNEDGEARKFPLPLHPTQLEVGGSVAMGVVVGNLFTVGGVLALGYAAGVAGPRLMPAYFSYGDAHGLTAFPSGPLLVFQVLYAGFSMGAMHLVLNARGAADACVGASAVALALGVPYACFRRVQAGIPSEGYFLRYDEVLPAPLRRWQWFLVGEGEWVSRSKHHMFMQRWSSMVRQYTAAAPWFFAIDLAGTFALAAMNAPEVDGMVGCGHVKLFSGLVFLVLFAVEAVQWPHVWERNGSLDVIALGLQVAAMFLMAAGFYGEGAGSPYVGLAGTLLIGSAVVMVIRAVLDLLAYLYLLCSGLRGRMQEAAFQQNLPEGALLHTETSFEKTPRGALRKDGNTSCTPTLWERRNENSGSSCLPEESMLVFEESFAALSGVVKDSPQRQAGSTLGRSLGRTVSDVSCPYPGTCVGQRSFGWVSSSDLCRQSTDASVLGGRRERRGRSSPFADREESTLERVKEWSSEDLRDVAMPGASRVSPMGQNRKLALRASRSRLTDELRLNSSYLKPPNRPGRGRLQQLSPANSASLARLSETGRTLSPEQLLPAQRAPLAQ